VHGSMIDGAGLVRLIAEKLLRRFGVQLSGSPLELHTHAHTPAFTFAQAFAHATHALHVLRKLNVSVSGECTTQTSARWLRISTHS
jgi:hypothetical protein